MTSFWIDESYKPIILTADVKDILAALLKILQYLLGTFASLGLALEVSNDNTTTGFLGLLSPLSL